MNHNDQNSNNDFFWVFENSYRGQKLGLLYIIVYILCLHKPCIYQRRYKIYYSEKALK